METRNFRVFRFTREDGPSRFDTFEVAVGTASTVLDALRWIKIHSDPSLAIRHSCFHASCGTCGVRVNGREALACVTHVGDLDPGQVTVEPMANFPVVADLVVEMASFVERFPSPHPTTRASESLPTAQAPSGVDEYERFEDCIECGLCLSACPVAATDDSYVGPAALAYAQRMLEEPRGANVGAILEWADGDNAAWRCHAAFECTEACPSDVRPAQRIMKLRRALTSGAGDGS
ncbi:MAG: succinate dehydrogenase/fumarate reductase iron-sulfur subunit [Actinomycetota bacterium]